MAGLNKVMLIGRLGKDPEIITFDNGARKMAVSLATSERYRDREGTWQDQTEWHNIVAWGNLANDIAEKRRNYIKGDLLFIEGKIKTRQYTDSQGITKYITEIIAERMNLITKGGQSGYGQAEYRTERTPTQDISSPSEDILPPATNMPDDDLPF